MEEKFEYILSYKILEGNMGAELYNPWLGKALPNVRPSLCLSPDLLGCDVLLSQKIA
jgi:hypothetical protein